MKRRTVSAAAVWSVAVLCAGVTQAPSQATLNDVTISTGVEPDSVTVGDRFRVGIRMSLPPGATIGLPAFDDPSGDLQLSEPARAVRDPEDPRTVVHVYPLVAWRPSARRPVVPVELTLPDGTTRRVRMELPLPHIRSVLPSDTAGIQPRGHRGIVEAEPRLAFWPLLVLLILLLAALIAFYLARRRRTFEGGSRIGSPQERALAELDDARRTLWLRTDQRPFFSAVSGAVRRYLAGVSPRWSTDLTTDELIRILADDGLDPHRRGQLLQVLESADRVKFARQQMDEAQADAIWHAARDCVQEVMIPDPQGERAATREAA